MSSNDHATYHDLSNEKLIRQYQREPSSSIATALHRRYQHLIFGICMKYLKDPNASEDISIEVMEKVLAQLKANIEVKNFSPWLYGMVRNECVSYIRKRKKSQELEEEHKMWKKSQSEFMENDGFVRLYNRGPLVNRELLVNEALKQLNQEQRQCLELYYYQEKSYKEIEQVTGFNHKKVKSALQNGKRNMKILLAELFEKTD